MEETRCQRSKLCRCLRTIPAAAICLLFLLGAGGPAYGTAPEAPEEPAFTWMREPPVYQRDGRPDPFMPFITEKLLQMEVPQEELTGMRRFEPGQLSLVSVVFTDTGPLAMVQDSVGRGYLIREGHQIGRSGLVARIIPNKVVIQQQMLTTSGETRFQTVEMVLRKEGEK